MPETPRFDPATLTGAAGDTASVRRVFGEAYTANGRTVIPVAKVWSATGLGVGDGEGALHGRGRGQAAGGAPASAQRVSGEQGASGVADAADDPGTASGAGPTDVAGPGHRRLRGDGHGAGHGGGGGYGTRVKAVGVYVVDDDGVHWQPALDLNRVILGGQVVAATALALGAVAWAVAGVARAVSDAIASR